MHASVMAAHQTGYAIPITTLHLADPPRSPVRLWPGYHVLVVHHVVPLALYGIVSPVALLHRFRHDPHSEDVLQLLNRFKAELPPLHHGNLAEYAVQRLWSTHHLGAYAVSLQVLLYQLHVLLYDFPARGTREQLLQAVVLFGMEVTEALILELTLGSLGRGGLSAVLILDEK